MDELDPQYDNHLHFGAGQTEATITLPEGRHTLQLLLGDAFHVPHQPPVYSNRIVVYVGMSHRTPFDTITGSTVDNVACRVVCCRSGDKFADAEAPARVSASGRTGVFAD